MADYHDHMPVNLDPRGYGAWLYPFMKPEIVNALLVPWPGNLTARQDARKFRIEG